MGVVLKSADQNQCVMTRAMIKKSYFFEEKYEVTGPDRLMREDGTPKNPAVPLV